MPAKGLLRRQLQTGLSSATFLLLLMDQHETGTARGLEFIAEIISGWEFWCPILHIMYNLDELVPRVPRAVICQEGNGDRTIPPPQLISLMAAPPRT